MIEEASILTFRSRSMVGDFLDDDKITWNVVKKSNRGTTEVDISDFESLRIGHFCLRPYLVPLSSSKVRLTILVYPTSFNELEATHALLKKAAFPGMELMQCDLEIFPLADSDIRKSWGCPLVPLFLLGGDPEESNHLPPTPEIKAAISATLRASIIPTTKRDLRSLGSAWTALQESGPSKLKERAPDCLWPLWTDSQIQRGE